MKILGLSAFHRDAAAALAFDGVPVAAERQEWFTKRPHDSTFPRRAAQSCLALADCTVRDLDRVVFYEKPLVKFERVLACQLAAFPRSVRSFGETMFVWLGDRLWLKNRIAAELEFAPEKVLCCEHHQAHAAGAFLPSPFDEAAILCVDDCGEWATTSMAVGRGTGIEMLAEQRFPHSLGLVASAVTQFLGFEPGADEAKVEALAALGRPRFAREFDELVRAREGGAFEIDRRRFRFGFDGSRLCDESIRELLGEPRISGGELRIDGVDARDADVAASLQALLEARVLELARELARRTELRTLCFTGQLAANRALVARLLRDGPFENVWVPPDPDDAGAALGAALMVEHSLEPARARCRDARVRLGAPIVDAGRSGGRALGEGVVAELAQRLGAGQCVAWVRGRMEFAPESLGARSTLAAAHSVGSRRRLHGTLRHTERFLAGRLAVPAERVGEFFEVPRAAEHLLRTAAFDATPRDALRRAVPDLDGRVRPQAVARDVDPEFHELLERIGASAGAPVLWHATLELRGSTCARSEEDALEAFRRSTLDALVVEDRLYERTAAAPVAT